MGREVATLIDGCQQAGTHRIPFGISPSSTLHQLTLGVYICVLTSGRQRLTRNMIVY